MSQFKSVRKLFADNSGATAIEYGLIAALIAVTIMTAVQSVGTSVSTSFQTAADKLK